jgi:hypothetical protein
VTAAVHAPVPQVDVDAPLSPLIPSELDLASELKVLDEMHKALLESESEQPKITPPTEMEMVTETEMETEMEMEMEMEKLASPSTADTTADVLAAAEAQAKLTAAMLAEPPAVIASPRADTDTGINGLRPLSDDSDDDEDSSTTPQQQQQQKQQFC